MLVAMTDVVVVAHRSGLFRRIHTQSPHYADPAYGPDQPESGQPQVVSEVFPQDVAQRFMAVTTAVLDRGQPQRLEYALNIHTVWFDASVSPLDANQVIWVARDISDRKHLQLSLERSQADLQRSEATYRLLFASNPHPLWVYDLETLAFLEVNAAAIHKYGYSREEFLAMTIADIRPAEDVPDLLDNIEQVSEGLNQAGFWRHQTKAGQIIEVEITSHTLTFNGRPAELVLSHDVTARRQAEIELFRYTLRDPLTQLPNRNFLTQRLQGLINQGRRQPQRGYALLFLDLDQFKIINDSLGHMVGDQVLVAVAQTLQSLVRSEDIVSRWGGDEFVLVLQDAQPLKAAIKLARRLVAEFQQPVQLSEREVFLGASIGIVIGHAAYTDPVDLLRDADIAMYRAKTEGRNRYAIFDEAMHELALQRLELEHDLRHALDREELVVYYQPIVSLADQHLVGLEALVRWHHPRRGLLGPGHFIPMAEDIGLITALDLWVLKAVCQQIAQWRSQLDLPRLPRVSVNLSVRDLWRPHLTETLDDMLATHSLEGAALSLEITESMLIQELETTTHLLHQFQDQGIHISIDDFGTGYSSLSYLPHLPVENLKIDYSFVHQMLDNHRHLKVVETIITLSHQLNFRVVAEGIETPEQFQMLRQLGCDRGQGYWFSPPLSATDTTTFLQATM